MVEEGETVLAPLVLTVPIVGLIEADVAFEDDHEIDEEPPDVMLEGVAVIEQVGAGVGAVTVTVAEQVPVPPVPVTVIV